MIAFVFPGQGSQEVGMGVSLAERFPDARIFFDQARDILGWDLLAVCREGPDDRLRQTDIAQPALYVTGYATFRVMRGLGVVPEDPTFGTAGHSVGEYAALAAAGVFTFEQGLRWVQARGALMQKAAQDRPGAMAAVLGMDRTAVEALCAELKSVGVCKPVNFNSPEQIVVAGEVAALDQFIILAPQRGAKRVVRLNVSGAFHSPLMDSAAAAMQDRLRTATFQKPTVAVVSNADGQGHQDAETLQQTLARQMNHPVEWVRSMEWFKSHGYTTFVECGPGRVLTGLLRRIDKQLRVFSTESVEAILQVGEALGASRKGLV